MLCPCKSQKSFNKCCQPIITYKLKAQTPEQLMRSRYSAYATKQAQYIFETYALSSQKEQSIDDIANWAEQCRWTGLTILNTLASTSMPTVEFIAYYVQGNSLYQLHEVSRFIQEDSHWRYLDGDIKCHHMLQKLSRNDPCPCASNKKFKRCCDLSP